MLSSDRIRLRRVEPQDYPFVQRWQNDPEVFRWMDYERPFTLDDIKRSEEQAVVEGHPFIIEADGKPVGRTGLNQFRWRDRTAALYLLIGDREVWGKGYAREALELLLQYAFDSLNLSLVHLYTLGDNERAIKLYKHLGFVAEATLRDRSHVGGRYVDHVVMSITREEFSRYQS